MCFGEDFCFAAAALLAAVCFEAPISAGVRPSGGWREGECGRAVELSLFHVFCKPKSCCRVRQGPVCHPLSAGLKVGSLSLGVAADTHGKEMISWE